ncbi:(+)-neomenthol dehydrogenase [Nymphaea thermarum]|nr:(+)-neomenthol dehydrogenase [Nymphaea thermarum]
MLELTNQKVEWLRVEGGVYAAEMQLLELWLEKRLKDRILGKAARGVGEDRRLPSRLKVTLILQLSSTEEKPSRRVKELSLPSSFPHSHRTNDTCSSSSRSPFFHQAGEPAAWWSEETVAVVTGANRGIGLEVCRQLADKGLTVIMTARKPQEQLSSAARQFLQEAAETGRKNVIFHTLDITQQQSVLDFVDWLKLSVGFADILVNNAAVDNSVIDWDLKDWNNVDQSTMLAILTWANGVTDKYESARGCLETNFYGTKRLTKALLPLLRRSSHKQRIVNVSSRYGLLCLLRDEELRKQLCDPATLTEEKIDEVLDLFLEDVKSEKGIERWPIKFPTYSISKISLNAYTRLLALQLHDKACVNSVHPGYVRTDMNLGNGDLSPAEGAANLVCVALLPPGGPSSHNFLEGKDAGEPAEWWSEETVAVVTGANRGIGLEVCRQLAEKGLTVIMTARKPQAQLSSAAQQFLQEAAEIGRKNVIFHTLDITQQQSVLDFVDWLKLSVGFTDILVNNAGVDNSVIDWDFKKRNNVDQSTNLALPTWANGVSEKYELAKGCLETNFYGTKRLSKALLPLLRPSSHKPRIVNVSSRYGLLCLLRNEELRKQLCDTATLTEEKIDEMLNMFLEDVKSEKGTDWPIEFPTYSISKISLNAYTRLLALQLHDKACVNSVHPGYVRTDMNLGNGDLSPAEGAANLVRVALLPPGGPSGHNFLEGEDVEF